MISSNSQIFCKDDISKIENYDIACKDQNQTWVCHHRLEITLDGYHARYSKELIRMNMYYNRPYFELIYLPSYIHSHMHKLAMQKAGIISNKGSHKPYNYIHIEPKNNKNEISEKKKEEPIEKPIEKPVEKTMKEKLEDTIFMENNENVNIVFTYEDEICTLNSNGITCLNLT